MTYVADTHAFLWWLAGQSRLGREATFAFEAAEAGRATIVLPTIALAESVRVLEKKRLPLGLEAVFRKLEIASNYVPGSLDLTVVAELPKLSRLKELHDRIIVATAIVHAAPVITKDEAIRRSGYVDTIW
ncbi:MAG: type II toxin-antitoxin system VapC family toxin [Acidobacteria bacterium]|nr:type II toxin-antitoxin system VapC family toxin [Acidobacteriota bacterium]